MSPRTALQNQHIRDERREEILHAALGVFARMGFEATKIADVAAASDMSHGLIYRYFPSKEAAFVALVELAVQGGLRLTEEALANVGTPWDRLRVLCERLLAGVQSRPEYPLIIVQAYASGTIPEAARSLLRRYGEQTHRNVAQLIRQGQAAGQVRTGNADELAAILLAMIQGLAVDRLETHTARRPFPRAHTFVDLFRV